MVQHLIKARAELSKRHGNESSAQNTIDLMQGFIDKKQEKRQQR